MLQTHPPARRPCPTLQGLMMREALTLSCRPAPSRTFGSPATWACNALGRAHTGLISNCLFNYGPCTPGAHGWPGCFQCSGQLRTKGFQLIWGYEARRLRGIRIAYLAEVAFGSCSLLHLLNCRLWRAQGSWGRNFLQGPVKLQGFHTFLAFVFAEETHSALQSDKLSGLQQPPPLRAAEPPWLKSGSPVRDSGLPCLYP